MRTRRYNLEINQGEDYKRAISAFAPNEEAPDQLPGQPQDLTGWSVAGQIRSTPTSEILLHQLDVSTSGTDVILFIPASASSGWDWLHGWYDIEISSPDGAQARFLKGEVIVDPEVTREG
jgi:hypothetical protein